MRKTQAVAAAVFGYECAAIASAGRLPTITALCSKNKIVSAVTVAALIVHLVDSRRIVIVVLEDEGPPG